MSTLYHDEYDKIPATDDEILKVKNLKKYFPVTGGFLSQVTGHVKAVDDISFTVRRGETLGLVGESGCGKTTLGKLILRLLEATGGEVFFEKQNILTLKQPELRKLRKDMQIIFQDPFASLNPRMTVGDIIAEPIEIHGLYSGVEKQKRINKLLDIVGLLPDHLQRYPHEFSGGQRQRIGIARALVLNPKLIICDEPVSALDVSIQAQILNLLSDLQKEYKITYIFIAHGLAAVKYISQRVGVMYLGKLVELADSEEVYRHPVHPYTKALMSAVLVPLPNPDVTTQRILLEGDIPELSHLPSGCRFHTRCPYAQDICREEEPLLVEHGDRHFAACHLGP